MSASVRQPLGGCARPHLQDFLERRQVDAVVRRHVLERGQERHPELAVARKAAVDQQEGKVGPLETRRPPPHIQDQKGVRAQMSSWMRRYQCAWSAGRTASVSGSMTRALMIWADDSAMTRASPCGMLGTYPRFMRYR